MGEMPPRASGTPGHSRRMAWPAAITISANFFQSGSSLKSQWDRLFGSFHSMMASIIASSCPFILQTTGGSCFRKSFSRKPAGLKRPRKFVVQDILPIFLGVGSQADPRLGLGMAGNLQPRTAQHALHRAVVGNPPIRGIARVALLDEVHAGKIRMVEYFLVPKVIVFPQRGAGQGAAHHGLEDEPAFHLFNDLVQGE